MNAKIRCRCDGRLEGVSGPATATVSRETIAGMMGWADSGRAEEVITKTMSLLGDGKAVRLTSHSGWCEFQPLADHEDGLKIPASWSTVYNPDGTVFSRKVS